MIDFKKETKQGQKIVAYIEIGDKINVVVERKSGDFAWGSYYDVTLGSWAYGHYDYNKKDDAIIDAINDFYMFRK